MALEIREIPVLYDNVAESFVNRVAANQNNRIADNHIKEMQDNLVAILNKACSHRSTERTMIS